MKTLVLGVKTLVLGVKTLVLCVKSGGKELKNPELVLLSGQMVLWFIQYETSGQSLNRLRCLLVPILILIRIVLLVREELILVLRVGNGFVFFCFARYRGDLDEISWSFKFFFFLVFIKNRKKKIRPDSVCK